MRLAPTSSRRPELPRATLTEILRILADVIAPTVAKGPIIRRPHMVALAERLDLDRRGIRRMQRLRDTHGAGPLLIKALGRSYALILDPAHVQRVLQESPEPFAAATPEKRAALSHFEPHGALISRGSDRADRRRFNEGALDADHRVHRLGERFAQVVREEQALLLDDTSGRGRLTWHTHTAAWFRMVRRVVLGDGARDDHVLTDMLAALRSDANWAFLRPKRTALRGRFFARLHRHLARAEPGSLAGAMAATPTTGRTEPAQQVPQWLFAFDAAAIATYRALALLALHPEQAERARQEIGEREGAARLDLPYLRACVLESVRLWPTTPLLLRESTEQTVWETGVMPAGTGVIIFAPFFHRDDQRLSYADRFSPEVWLDEADQSATTWPLVPFSAGPVICPGRNLVLLLASAALAALLEARELRLLAPAHLTADRPLPATLNHTAVTIGLR